MKPLLLHLYYVSDSSFIRPSVSVVSSASRSMLTIIYRCRCSHSCTQGGAKISGDHSLNMAMQGVQSCSATCDPVLDVAQGVPGHSATREDASGRLPPSRNGKGKRAGCSAAAQSQVTVTESFAKPVVASGSKSSTTEVNTAAPAAATMDQELPGTSTAAAEVGRGLLDKVDILCLHIWRRS